MHTDVRASSASSVCSPTTLVLVTVADCAGVEGSSGDAPCDDHRDVRTQIKAVTLKMPTRIFAVMDACTNALCVGAACFAAWV